MPLDLQAELMKRVAIEQSLKAVPTPAPPTKPGLSGLDKFYMGAAGADMVSTGWFLSHPELGIKEGNPLVSKLPSSAQLPVGAGLEVLANLIARKYIKPNHPNIYKAVVGAGAGLHGGLALNNLRLIKNAGNK